MDPILIIGYLATSASVFGYVSQFVHTIKTKTISGLSLNRTVLDTVSLVLWVGYAARTEDIPLLTATSCELLMSLSVCVLILKEHRKKTNIVASDKSSTASSRSNSSDDYIINVKSERRNSI